MRRSADDHRKLDYVHRVISDGSCSVLSLDVFDTILWRRVPEPVDLFELLGARLRQAGRSDDKKEGWLDYVGKNSIGKLIGGAFTGCMSVFLAAGAGCNAGGIVGSEAGALGGTVKEMITCDW